MRLALPVYAGMEMVELPGYWGLSPCRGSTAQESKEMKQEERKT